MGRVLKSLALVVAGAVLGATVVAGAVGPTTIDPVTLCVSKTGSVRVSPNDTCASRETTVQVASAADVAALASRMDVAEETAADQASAIAALEAQLAALQPEIMIVERDPCLDCGPGEWGFDVSAKGLRPGTTLRVRWEQDPSQVFDLSAWPVQGDGTLTQSFRWTCLGGPLYLTGQGWLDSDASPEGIVSDTLWGAGCST